MSKVLRTFLTFALYKEIWQDFIKNKKSKRSNTIPPLLSFMILTALSSSLLDYFNLFLIGTLGVFHYLNSTINPIVYSLMSRRFNDGYQNLKKSLMSGGCRCRQSTVLSEEEDTYELFRKNIISTYNQGLKKYILLTVYFRN